MYTVTIRVGESYYQRQVFGNMALMDIMNNNKVVAVVIRGDDGCT
jgi:hypothetical protein